jgi:hypothetical protein
MSKRALFLFPVIALLSMACGLVSALPGGREIQDALTQVAPALSTAGVPAISTAAASANEPALGLPVFEQDHDKVVSSVENGDARTLYDQINESDAGEMFAPDTQRYTVDLKPADLVDLSTGWCAKNKAIMDANEKHVTGSITVDDYVIPNDQLASFSSEVKPGTSEGYPDGLSCYSWDIVASQWPVGTHTVIESWTLDSPLNDGYADYKAGTYAVQYTVTVSE